MARFICNAWPKYRVVDKDRVLAFDRGSLDTDDRGAALIRSLPEFGRRIFEGDESAPAHGEVPKDVLSHRHTSTSDLGFYCGDCDQVFQKESQYEAHMKRLHGGAS